MSPTPAKLALIGFGAFGQLIAAHLPPHLRVHVIDPDPAAKAAAHALGLCPAGIEVVGDCDWVLLAVPLGALRPVLHQIAPLLRPGAVVMDVVSVKEEPARLMQDVLPEHVELLATHPLFGPQSARTGLAGAKVALCPLRGRRWRAVAVVLRRAGLRVLRMTPQDHDREAAVGQAIVHYLARAMEEFAIPRAVTTCSFDQLVAALALVRHDPPEVAAAVLQGNLHAPAVGRRLAAAIAAQARGDAPTA